MALSSRHVEKELVVKMSEPSTPKGRVMKSAAAVRARMPVVGRIVVLLVCICGRNAFGALADQTPKLLTKHVRSGMIDLFNEGRSRWRRRTEGEEATSTNGVSDSFQKMRSDSECRIRRDVGRMNGNERLGRTRSVAQKMLYKEREQVQNDVYQHAAELQETSV